MPFCTDCGTTNDDGSRFCQSCGSGLPATAVSPALPALGAAFSNNLSLGDKIAAGASLTALLTFFFPWIGFFGARLSGYDFAFVDKPMTLFLLLIPLCTISICSVLYLTLQGKMERGTFSTLAILLSAVYLLLHIFFYFSARRELGGQSPFSFFSGWYLLNVLCPIVTIAATIMERMGVIGARSVNGR